MKLSILNASYCPPGFVSVQKEGKNGGGRGKEREREREREREKDRDNELRHAYLPRGPGTGQREWSNIYTTTIIQGALPSRLT